MPALAMANSNATMVVMTSSVRPRFSSGTGDNKIGGSTTLVADASPTGRTAVGSGRVSAGPAGPVGLPTAPASALLSTRGTAIGSVGAATAPAALLTIGAAPDGAAPDGAAPDGPACDEPATDGPATDGPATDGPATVG